jgi:VanZ family protein
MDAGIEPADPMKSFFRYWLPVIALCVIIFWQSSYASPDILPRWPFQDKLLHGGVYGLLAALWVRAFNTLKGFHGRRRLLLLTGIVLATLYGFSDEWHQSFVPSRTADPADLLADFCGSVVGSWVFIRLARWPVGPLAR